MFGGSFLGDRRMSFRRLPSANMPYLYGASSYAAASPYYYGSYAASPYYGASYAAARDRRLRCFASTPSPPGALDRTSRTPVSLSTPAPLAFRLWCGGLVEKTAFSGERAGEVWRAAPVGCVTG